MKQPMSQKELEVWDAIAIAYISHSGCGIKRAHEVATRAIAARIATLIADAHVGESLGKSWECRCIENEKHFAGDEYCEACHTRRPDAEVTP